MAVPGRRLLEDARGAAAVGALAAVAVAVVATCLTVGRPSSSPVSGATVWGPPPSSRAGAGPGGPDRGSEPSLGSIVVGDPLPGFVPAPPGPANGSPSVTELATQASDPQQVQTLVSRFATMPGFGAYLRLWTGILGGGPGTGDLVSVVLVRVPDERAAAALLEGLADPARNVPGTSTFAVPAIPGATGVTVSAAGPGDSVEQLVSFRSGRYVVLVRLASTADPGSSAPLTPDQALVVGFRQFTLVRTVGNGGRQPVAADFGPPGTGTGTGTTGTSTVLTLVAVGGAAVASLVLGQLGDRWRSGLRRRQRREA